MMVNADATAFPLKGEGFHCILFSPPFWALRKYAGEQERVWGGDPDCNHGWVDNWSGKLLPEDRRTNPYDRCLCGARRSALGLEPTPEIYIEHMRLVMRECWRVLRNDGVCFVELGDCYTGSGGPGGDYHEGSRRKDEATEGANPNRKLRRKSLAAIPARFQLMVMEEGWIVRSIIVWAKGVSFNKPPAVDGLVRRWAMSRGIGDCEDLIEELNAYLESQMYNGSVMPESVPDRPTKAWTHIFMLTKSERAWVDMVGVREEGEFDPGGVRGYRGGNIDNSQKPEVFRGPRRFEGRNLRNVWNIPDMICLNPKGYSGAHFAVWPVELAATLLKMGCPPMTCPECGKGWVRITDANRADEDGIRCATRQQGQLRDLGWQPSCGCGREDWIPGIALDPFGGSGSTGIAALQLNRRVLLIDLSLEYILQHQKERTAAVQRTFEFG
jgi:hypothetical protein